MSLWPDSVLIIDEVHKYTRSSEQGSRIMFCQTLPAELSFRVHKFPFEHWSLATFGMDSETKEFRLCSRCHHKTGKIRAPLKVLVILQLGSSKVIWQAPLKRNLEGTILRTGHLDDCMEHQATSHACSPLTSSCCSSCRLWRLLSYCWKASNRKHTDNILPPSVLSGRVSFSSSGLWELNSWGNHQWIAAF